MSSTQVPTARARCSRGNVLVIVDRVAGMTSAAPMPSTPRRVMSQLASWTVSAPIDPAPKIASPATRVRRRP
jgi:hypothetical protein